jgi:cation transport ATPase
MRDFIRKLIKHRSGKMNTGQIPIVQGVAVPSGGYYQQQQQQNQQLFNYNNASLQEANDPYSQANYNGFKGEEQPKEFQDVFWAILFVAHLVVMIVLMSMMYPSIQSGGYNASGVMWCVSVCALVALAFSTIALGVMMQFATLMVQMALIFSVGCSLAVGILGVLTGQMWTAILGFISFAIGCCYAYFVWARIPVSSMFAFNWGSIDRCSVTNYFSDLNYQFLIVVFTLHIAVCSSQLANSFVRCQG